MRTLFRLRVTGGGGDGGKKVFGGIGRRMLAGGLLAASAAGGILAWRSRENQHAAPASEQPTATTVVEAMVGLGAVFPPRARAVVAHCKSEKEEAPAAQLPHLVVLGSGWAAFSFLQNVDLDRYDVTCVSPESSFLYTPLLSDVATGRVNGASVCAELPVLLGHERASRIQFVQGRATDVDFEGNRVLFEDAAGRPNQSVSYDSLVLAVGAVNHCYGLDAQVNAAPDVFRLRNLADARAIRQSVVDCFERAVQPGLADAERARLLSFAVVGGGVVSLELAERLRRYTEQLAKLHQVGNQAGILQPKITLIDVGDYNANAYDVKIAEQARARAHPDAVRRAKVTRVADGALQLLGGGDDDSAVESFPFGLCVWTTARGPSPLIKRLKARLGATAQDNHHALVTDDHLRVRGLPGGQKNVFALGDCATISQGRLVESIVALFQELDVNHDDQLSPAEFHALVHDYQAEFPQLSEWASRTDELFAQADVNHDGSLSTDEFRALLLRVDADVTRLPSTAAVAAQQGKYLARTLSNNTFFMTTRRGQQDIDQGLYETDTGGNLPFRYKHLGGFEYIGYDNTITTRATKAQNIIDGKGARWLWSSILFSWISPPRILIRSSIDKFISFVFGPDST